MKSHYLCVYHPLTEKEYLESISWYEDNQLGLSVDFITEIEKVLNHIEANPFLYPVKKREFREAPVKNFPYIIVYKINPKQKQVIVLSVFHTRRKPSIKYKRYP